MLSAKGCRSSSAGRMDAVAPLVHGRHGRGPMLGCGRSAAPAASGRRTTRVAYRCGLCLLCVDSVCVRWCMARYASRRIATVGSRTRATRWMSTSQSARCVAARFRSIYVTVTQVTLTHVAAYRLGGVKDIFGRGRTHATKIPTCAQEFSGADVHTLTHSTSSGTEEKNHRPQPRPEQCSAPAAPNTQHRRRPTHPAARGQDALPEARSPPTRGHIAPRRTATLLSRNAEPHCRAAPPL